MINCKFQTNFVCLEPSSHYHKKTFMYTPANPTFKWGLLACSLNEIDYVYDRNQRKTWITLHKCGNGAFVTLTTL